VATSPDLAAFALKVDKVLNELDDPGLFRAVGMEGKKLADRAVRNDIGDMSMSGWRRGNPFDVKSRFDVAERTVEISPERRAKGPMRVLEEGRKAYNAGDSRSSGSRVRKRDGAVIAKTRKVKRNVGAHGGKGTWSDATADMERELPKAAHQHVTRVLRKHF
jgi:hypothetical protein